MSDTTKTIQEECYGICWGAQQRIDELTQYLNAANERIKRLEAVVNDPHALWTNWLRGDVKLPEGIGDVRQYQERIKRLEEAGIELRECASWVGHACCQYVDQIRRAKAAIEAWDKEAKL